MGKSAKLISEEKKALSEAPILIVDKKGFLGDLLSQKLQKDTLVVFVSEKTPTPGNVVHIPYTKQFPTIPNNTYSYMFIIDDEKYLRESIFSFVKKAEQDKSPLVFITYLREMQEKTVEYLISEYKRAKVVIYGDMFGKNIPVSEGAIVNNFIYQAQKLEKIEIPGDGTREIYPVFLDDVIEGILKAVFGQSIKNQIFYLFQKHPLTYLSLLHILQKQDPAIKIDFVRKTEGKINRTLPLGEGEYLLEDNYSIEQRIKRAFWQAESEQNKTEEGFPSQTKEKYPRHIRFFLFLMLFLFLLPLVSTSFFSFLGAKTLGDVNATFDKGNLEAAKEKVNQSEKFFLSALATAKILAWQAKLIGLDKQTETFIEKIKVGEKTSLAASNLTDAFLFFKNITSGNATDLKNDFEKLQTYVRYSGVLISEIKTEEAVFPSITKKIQKENEVINFVMNVQGELSDIFGVSGKKTYLVLFQNNMELRPGGGFIGSYGLLTLDKGRIMDFSIHDVYDADGQLKGHVEPPYPIRRYLPLPMEHWFLRDSNFDVDFTRSASASAFFLNAETGQMVDGVIGVDVSFVKSFLAAIGPVKVPEYNETVNADNLFFLTEQHAEKNFFPSSRQKKDFLSYLFKAIQEKLSSRKSLSFLAIAKSITQSLDEKHLVFAFNSPSVQNIFTVNGWSSSLWDDRKTSTDSINDFVGINEANLGANKANYFIARSVSYDVKMEDKGTLSSKLTISYKNESTSPSWPGGDYKNYLRFILPLNSELLDISIDNVSQKIINAITNPAIYEEKNFVPPNGLEVEKTEELGKTIYGFLVLVPAGSLKTISVNYKLSQKISQDSPSFSYNLKVFKQPGTDGYPFQFSFFYPSSYQPISSFKNLSYKDNKILFSEELLSDKNISSSFGKK